jgi:hypothetical protein
MPIATSVTRVCFVPPQMGTVNLRLLDSTGVSSATPLTIAGDTVVVPQVQLPFSEWKCEVISLPNTKGRMFFRVGDTVTG